MFRYNRKQQNKILFDQNDSEYDFDYDYTYDNYDDDWNCNRCYHYFCACELYESKEAHLLVAEAFADKIIYENNLGNEIKQFLISDRMLEYNSYSGADAAFKADIAYILTFIKDTDKWPILFAKLFGQKDC